MAVPRQPIQPAGSRMRGDGVFADAIHEMFDGHRRRTGLAGAIELCTTAFRRPPGPQQTLF